MADGPEGEGDGDFVLFLVLLVFFSVAVAIAIAATAGRRDYGDDFAEGAGRVAGSPGVLYLLVHAGPDFGFVVFEVGHEVVPCCGGAEGFD